MVQVFRPKEAESVRLIQQTKEDRARQVEIFREQKALEKEHKDRRFAEIEERRKNRDFKASEKGRDTINIEVYEE